MDLERPELDVPFNVRNYEGGYLGMGTDTFVHDVHIFNSGTMANVVNMTIHHGGNVHLTYHGHTLEEDPNIYKYDIIFNSHCKTSEHVLLCYELIPHQ